MLTFLLVQSSTRLFGNLFHLSVPCWVFRHTKGLWHAAGAHDTLMPECKRNFTLTRTTSRWWRFGWMDDWDAGRQIKSSGGCQCILLIYMTMRCIKSSESWQRSIHWSHDYFPLCDKFVKTFCTTRAAWGIKQISVFFCFVKKYQRASHAQNIIRIRGAVLSGGETSWLCSRPHPRKMPFLKRATLPWLERVCENTKTRSCP